MATVSKSEKEVPKLPTELLNQLTSFVKTEQDLTLVTNQLMKQVVERALQAELSHHLDAQGVDAQSNSRNGFMGKVLKGQFGQIPIQTPRDRNGSFEPVLVRKSQTRFTAFDDQILALYARGMSTRDIADMFGQMYGADISHSLISQVTEAVLDEVHAWQSRPLDAVYPIVYLDCLMVKVNHDKRVINKAVYLALGINLEGQKELLGMWISENEGSKFWLDVLTQLQNRGVHDILIACVDGLTGFAQAITTVFPKAQVQLCMVHMVRNSLRYVAAKHMKEVAHDLKMIYRSVTAQEAQEALDVFAKKWDNSYPSIAKSWRNHWPNLITLFDYPDEIRKVIYTTNAIESLNSVIRKAIKNRKIFPNDNAAFKMIYLATQQASKSWTMPIQNWKAALNRFMIEFGDRVPPLR